MRLDKYESSANKAKTVFTFISEGPKGKIVKRVQFSLLRIEGVKNLYNLAFGDILEGSNVINDLSITDNQDRDKVLATVVNSVYRFSERHPKAMIMNNITLSKKFTYSESKYDPSLDAYTDVVLFPQKVELATEHFKKYVLPHLEKKPKKSKKKSLSPLQNELLMVYTFDPTEQQMQELKAFLQQHNRFSDGGIFVLFRCRCVQVNQ